MPRNMKPVARTLISGFVAIIVALGHATYAFAPLAFGVLLASDDVAPRFGHGATHFFIAAVAIQAAAIACFLAGRRRD